MHAYLSKVFFFPALLYLPGSTLPTGESLKLPSHREALFPLGSPLPTGKLSSHWEALFPLESSLPTRKLPRLSQVRKLFSHWKALFPLGSSFPLAKFISGPPLYLLGNSLPTGKLKALFPPSNREALFPLVSSLCS